MISVLRLLVAPPTRERGCFSSVREGRVRITYALGLRGTIPLSDSRPHSARSGRGFERVLQITYRQRRGKLRPDIARLISFGLGQPRPLAALANLRLALHRTQQPRSTRLLERARAPFVFQGAQEIEQHGRAKRPA